MGRASASPGRKGLQSLRERFFADRAKSRNHPLPKTARLPLREASDRPDRLEALPDRSDPPDQPRDSERPDPFELELLEEFELEFEELLELELEELFEEEFELELDEELELEFEELLDDEFELELLDEFDELLPARMIGAPVEVIPG